MISPLATGLSAGVGAAAAVGLAVGAYAYASTWPSSTIFGKALIAPERPSEIALTFDDGPNAKWTPRLLDALAKYDVRATFFSLGIHAEAEPALVRQMAAAGHIVGNHSWDHPNMARSSAQRIREQLTHTSEMLEQTIGAPVKFFRPPYGARRPVVFRIAREMGLQPVLWNAMTSDWSDPSAQRIAAQLSQMIAGQRRRGNAVNIVLHDGGHNDPGANREPSVTAAEMLIQRHKETYRFVTLDEWS